MSSAAKKLELKNTHLALIADDQVDIVNIMKFFIESEYNFDIIVAQNGMEAIDLLNKFPNVDIIFCDHTMSPGNAQTVYDFLKDQNREIPFIFTSGKQVQNFKGFENAALVKGINKKEMLLELPQVIQSFFEVDVKIPPKEFTGISIETLLSFTQLHEDVYIQLSSGRYLKYFSKKDQVLSDDVKKLKEKKVTKLFLKKESLTWIKRELQESFPAIVAGKAKLEDLKFVKAVQEDRLKVSSPFEYEKEFLDQIQEERDHALRKIAMNPRLRALLKRLKVNKDDYYNGHIELLCSVACAIAKNLEWATQETMAKMIYAAYLHDILFVDHPHLARIPDLAEFNKMKHELTDYEQKIFLENPNYITQVAREDNKAPPDMEYILLQHRELPDGSGFPRGLKHNQMNALACLFMVAHDLVDELYINPNLDLFSYAKKARKKFFGKHFEKIFKGVINSGGGSAT
ncbi:MAG: response regulator [Bacteriovoracaceae bacterium]|nr:response regulator [Bacteriovoracaceae bacterium]